MAPRLPIPNADNNAWGDILNEYLDVAHNSDGTAKNVLIANGGTSATTASQALTNLGGVSNAQAQTIVDAHVNDTSAAHTASAIAFTPASTVAATDVQAAIAEM